ncbi:MAG: 3-hydroxyacyl-CoA dehydrogenase NAD-binding domain-containing protein [Lautropia sp.]|nr:3-hydroxyacyl-CoA dehydrogenase NAD-binding domain-containing protein [Lautropia sp.]
MRVHGKVSDSGSPQLDESQTDHVLSVAKSGRIAVLNLANPPVNALSRTVRQALLLAVARCDADPAVDAALLICDGRTFIAGADVSEFDRPPEEPHLPAVVQTIEGAAKPWLAAIHGSALGGGLEVAMACRYRVALESARFGLPEVKLGLLPGAGGTVRLPRLVGGESAQAMITLGSTISAAQALADGLVDAVFSVETVTDLQSEAITFLQNALKQPLPLPASQRSVGPVDEACWQKTESSLRKRHPHEPAPLLALQCVRRACTSEPVESLLAAEREAFLTLRASPQAKALRHVFFAERAAARPAGLKGVGAADIRSVAVVGAGTMGVGIVQALRGANIPVVLIEKDEKALTNGLSRISSALQERVQRGRLDESAMGRYLSGIRGSSDCSAAATADLVIEAVFEDLQVKRKLFETLAEHCSSQTILATNTSYLDPRAIFAGIPEEQRCIGLHFFSPAQVMKLMEIIPLPGTSKQTRATAFDLARKLNKIPVQAGICDGFIGNRLVRIMRAQAERMVLAGASLQQVDAAMRAWGMAMGPFEAQDMGGLDIAAFQRRAARERGEPVFAPLADQLCEMGRLGRKTGGGWYDYPPADARGAARSAGGTSLVASETVERLIASSRNSQAASNLSASELSDGLILPMINEAAILLAEGIARRASDVDLVEIHGYGFPRWRGGLLHAAESVGLPEVLRRLENLAEQQLAPAPSSALMRMVEANSVSCFDDSPF